MGAGTFDTGSQPMVKNQLHIFFATKAKTDEWQNT